MKNHNLDVHLSIEDVASLLKLPNEKIEMLIRCGIHPPWHWLACMKRPRFSQSTIPAWLRIRDEIDLDSLPTHPPPLEARRPTNVFDVRNEPSPEELLIARRMLGLSADYNLPS